MPIFEIRMSAAEGDNWRSIQLEADDKDEAKDRANQQARQLAADDNSAPYTIDRGYPKEL